MIVEEAIIIVAQHIAHWMLLEVHGEWENYPEIGEADWVQVVRSVGKRVPDVDSRQYLAAYALLSARAEET